MNCKKLILSIALISLSNTFGQYTSQTGLRILDATATTPSPGIKFWGSADTDGFLYSTKFINGYGFGFYNKSNGDTYNNGMNTYLSGFFGMDFFTNSQFRLRISREGNVGIGTETPEALLHVNGDIKTNQKFIFGNSELTPDQGGAFVLKANTSTATPYIDFNRFGETSYYTSRFVLSAPQQYTNNQPKLTLLGSTLTFQQGVEFLHSPYENGFGSKIYGTDNGNGTTSLRFAVRANSNTFTDAMVIRTDYGNIGIGTDNPGGKLDINLGGWGSIPRVVFKSVSDNPGINFYRPTGSGSTAYPWRIEENLGALEFQTGSFANVGSESLKTVLSIDQYNVEIGKGNNQVGQRSSLQISSFDAGAKFFGTIHSNWEENQRTFDIYTNDQVSQLKIDASSNPYGKILLLPGTNANVGIGTLNPTEKLQIGNAFTFAAGGHDIIGFGYTPSNSTDLNTNAYSAEMRFKKDSGSLSLGVSQDAVSNPTTALEIWKNNNVTMSYYDWGKVGIGTNNPDAKLTVNGDIHAKEVRVDLNVAPDYVFEKYYDGYSALKNDYKMPTLQEVEAYTKENKHLPEVPSAQEIKENGIKLGEMNAILLQKVEELTLYLIEQNKEIEKLKTKVDNLSKK